MRVLFLMFAFPDMNKSFNMYTALVDQFNQEGNEVTILAPSARGQSAGKYIENGIEVLRVKTLPIKNVSIIAKGISNLLLPKQYYRALKRFYPDNSFDIIIIPTPPITLGSLANRIRKRYNAKLYLILRDIFPQNAVDLGFMKSGGIIHKFFAAKENFLYDSADAVGCMSQGNIDYVLEHHRKLDRKKFHILRNWQYLYQGFGNSTNELKEKYGLKEKFVVVFGGNMGKPQQLENVLELARRCQRFPEVIFLLLGEGVAMEKLKLSIEERKISNIHIKGTIPKQEYQDLLQNCNIGLISLHENFTIPNIPSKALDYFNVGLPILASIDKATDFGKVLDDANTGKWSYAGDHNAFEKNFEALYENTKLCKIMGANGRSYLEKFLTPKIAYQTIIENFR